MEFLIATNNTKKLAEMQRLLKAGGAHRHWPGGGGH